MSNVRKKENPIVGWIKHLLGRSAVVMLMYFAVSAAIVMLSMQGETLQYGKMMTVWGIGFAILIAYNFFFAWVNAGADYEMLVSGNLKRRSLGEGATLNISSHKEYKEYRPWKGFVYASLPALFALFAAIIFGVNNQAVNETIKNGDPMQASRGWLVFLGFLTSGWSVLPFYASNLAGMTPNYFLSMLFVLIPLVLSVAGYIGGAYAKRAKVMKEQELQDKQREREAQRERKANLGAVAGTSHKKRK